MATPITPQIAVVRLKDLIADKEWNVRTDTKSTKIEGGYGPLAELKASMEKEGQLQPIILRAHPKEADKFLVVAGFRRMRVAEQLGWPTIRAEIRQYDEAEASWINLQENEQRRSLSGYEKSKGYHRQVVTHKWSAKDVAGRAGCDVSTVENHVRIMSNAIPEALAKYQDSTWNFDILGKLSSLSKSVQKELVAALGNRRGAEAVAGIAEYKATGKMPGTEESATQGASPDSPPTKAPYKPGKSALAAAFKWAKAEGVTEAENILGWVLGESGYGGTKLRVGNKEFSAKKPRKVAANKAE